jgi:hypothetical protein
MKNTVLEKMMLDAKECNKRLRAITGNSPSHEKMVQMKICGAKGGYNSHANGNKVGKNGPRKQSRSA